MINNREYEDWIESQEWLKANDLSFGFQFNYCPECGKILSEVRTYHWSHDHSYKTGYTLTSRCIFCGYSEVYHDVE